MGQEQAETPSPWVPRDTFAARLKLIRHEKGLTVEQAARLCDVAPATWSTWERGVHPQAMENAVRKIARATGVDRHWLFFGLETVVDLRVIPGEPSGGPEQLVFRPFSSVI